MLLRKKLIVLTILIASGCTPVEKVRVEKVYIENPKLQIDIPQIDTLSNIDYIVVNDKNVSEKFSNLVSKGRLPILVCITPKNYENLSLNTQKLENHIVELKSILKKYKEYYEK